MVDGAKVASLQSWQVLLVTSAHPAAFQEPSKSHLIRTEDTPVTQEIPRDEGALCQAPGADTDIHVFHYLTRPRCKSLETLSSNTDTSSVL